jgi:hypothetical protein
VIPKSLREQSGIVSGEVEISLDGAAIRIESVAADDLIEEDGLLLLPNGGPVAACRPTLTMSSLTPARHLHWSSARTDSI